MLALLRSPSGPYGLALQFRLVWMWQRPVIPEIFDLTLAESVMGVGGKVELLRLEYANTKFCWAGSK